MQKYNFLDPNNNENDITVPNYIVQKIINDYLQKTYYWSVGLFSFIIGMLIGVSI
jgi:hypothetical protein